MATRIKGNYNLTDVFKLEIANDWPTAQVIFTSDIVESTSNLYFTTSRARSAFTAGLGIAISTGGVISAKGDDTGTGMFNSGINLSVGQLVSNVYANLVTFSAVDGDSFIVYSLHATNITGNTVYLNGRYVVNNGNAANTVLFANLFEIPGNTSLELLRKPQVFKPDDQIQLLSYSDPQQPANDLVSVYMSYQASPDTAYNRVANTITNNKLTEVFRTPAQTSIIESLVLNNLSPNVIPVTTFIVDSSNNVLSYLTSNLSLPPRTSVEICEYPKAISEDHKIRINKFGAENDQLSVFITSKFTTYYAITPSSANISEGESIIFNIETLNIGNGTTLYYTLEEVSGNIAQNDFITDISGEVTIQNDAAVLTLQSNADATSFTEGPDIFRLQLRRGSTFGTIITTSSNVTILDTSNIRTSSLNISGLNGPNVILDNSVLTVTINTTNFQNNDTLYYRMSGNALSSHFAEGNAGTLILTENSNILTLTIGDIPANTTRTFDLEIRDTDENGELLVNSGEIVIIDQNLAFTSATGGTITTVSENGVNYTVHAFTTTGTLNISAVGQIDPYIQYLAVAGGGGTGIRVPGSGYAGGGAGGLLFGNVIVPSGSHTMTVGAGGATVGSNTIIFNNLLVAVRGGASSYGYPSSISDGGSGGGLGVGAGNPAQLASNAYGFPGIVGNTQQGYPGGSAPVGGGNYGALSGGGGAGGAGGPSNGLTGTLGAGGAGLVIPWVPSLYGSPARLFAAGGGAGNAPLVGTTNTGNGGRGGPASGGSGIVIVRYRTQ